MRQLILWLVLIVVLIGGGLFLYNNQKSSDVPVTQIDTTPQSDPATSNPLEGTTWQWEETQYNNGDVVRPATSEAFSLSFIENQQFSATTDCNNLMGKFEADMTMNAISFGQIASTRMACPETSQENDFREMLEGSQGFIITDDGKLALTLRYDSGSVIFAPGTTPAVVEEDDEQSVHSEIFGMTEAQAAVYAQTKNVPFRVISRDGESLPVTLDYRPGRINAEVESGVVIDFTTE